MTPQRHKYETANNSAIEQTIYLSPSAIEIINTRTRDFRLRKLPKSQYQGYPVARHKGRFDDRP